MTIDELLSHAASRADEVDARGFRAKLLQFALHADVQQMTKLRSILIIEEYTKAAVKRIAEDGC